MSRSVPSTSHKPSAPMTKTRQFALNLAVEYEYGVTSMSLVLETIHSEDLLSINRSAAYRVLCKLVAMGLLEPHGRSNRDRSWRITAAGRRLATPKRATS